jgi:predicted ATPase
LTEFIYLKFVNGERSVDAMRDDKELCVVALTGGSCGGKSSFLELVRGLGEINGWRLLTIPEASSLLAENGLDREHDLFAWQDAIFSTQLSFEEAYKRYARACGGKTCLVCDRSLLDGLVYLGEREFDRLCYCHGLGIGELYSRYDNVFYFESVCVGLPEFYESQSNPYRWESFEEAVRAERLEKELWRGRKNVSYFLNYPGKSLEDKLAEAKKELERVLSC